jgi:phytoene dehydrogenase-like protein
MSDVIVVGAGHNGLVAVCYLAKAGADVLVVEANAVAGGCTTTAPLVAEAPDHLLSPCAADIITMRASTVVADLALHRHGYREIEIEPAYVTLLPDGASLAMRRDPRRTADEMRRFSAADANAFLELMRTFDDVLDAALPLVATNPTRPGVRARAGRAAARHPRSVAAVLGLAGASAVQAIAERFTHPIVQSAIATIANFGAPITGEGTGINLMVPAVVQRFGMVRPVGGMGALPAALERCVASHRGRLRTGSPVEQVLVRAGRAIGVRLESGEELGARAVLCATEPDRALTKLLPGGSLPRHLEQRARHIPCRNDGSGRLARPLPFVSMVPTAADATQAPAGQDTLSLWSGWLPHEPPGGWPSFKGVVEKEFVANAMEYYDGIEELELGRAVETPGEISARTGVRDGNVYHVDMSLTRVGALRPALGFGGYRTPVAGFYITGAGTHPGPSVSGIPGQQAARTLLRDLRSDRGAPPVAVAPPSFESREREAVPA